LSVGATYYFSAAAATITLGPQQAFHLYGNRAKLLFHNSNGLSFNYTPSPGYGLGGSQLLISDTDFVTDGKGFTGLAVNGHIQATQLVTPTYLIRNHYYGTNQTAGGGGNYWGIARAFTDASNIVADGEAVTGMVPAYLGIGLDVQGTSSASTPSVANLSNEQDWWLQTGVNVHGYFQGLNVGRGSNFVGLAYGVVCDAPIGEYQCDVHDSSFNVTTSAVKINNWVDSTIQGNDIGGGVYNGTPTGTPGLVALSGSATNTIISGNHLEANNSGDGNWNACITLTGAGTGNAIITSNYMVCNHQDVVATGNPQGVTVLGNRRGAGGSDVVGLVAPFMVADATGMWISAGNNLDGDLAWNGHVGPKDVTVLPTLSACGATPYIESGGDAGGTIVMAAAGTGCQLTFAKAHTLYTSCTLTPHQASAVPHFTYNQTLTGFTASWPGDGSQAPAISYICFGH
jgi:hypothetical protein